MKAAESSNSVSSFCASRVTEELEAPPAAAEFPDPGAATLPFVAGENRYNEKPSASRIAAATPNAAIRDLNLSFDDASFVRRNSFIRVVSTREEASRPDSAEAIARNAKSSDLARVKRSAQRLQDSACAKAPSRRKKPTVPGRLRS